MQFGDNRLDVDRLGDDRVVRRVVLLQRLLQEHLHRIHTAVLALHDVPEDELDAFTERSVVVLGQEALAQ